MAGTIGTGVHHATGTPRGTQLPEFALQGTLTALLLLGRKWFGLLLHAPVAAFHARVFVRNEWRVDVTEIFQQSQREKLRRLVKLGVYFIGFLLVVFRCACLFFPHATASRTRAAAQDGRNGGVDVADARRSRHCTQTDARSNSHHAHLASCSSLMLV